MPPHPKSRIGDNKTVFSTALNTCKNFIDRIKQQLKELTKPAAAIIAAGTVSDLPRSRADLIVENAILRQQLVVLQRHVKRPKLTIGDQIRLVFLAHFTQF